MHPDAHKDPLMLGGIIVDVRSGQINMLARSIGATIELQAQGYRARNGIVVVVISLVVRDKGFGKKETTGRPRQKATAGCPRILGTKMLVEPLLVQRDFYGLQEFRDIGTNLGTRGLDSHGMLESLRTSPTSGFADGGLDEILEMTSIFEIAFVDGSRSVGFEGESKRNFK